VKSPKNSINLKKGVSFNDDNTGADTMFFRRRITTSEHTRNLIIETTNSFEGDNEDLPNDNRTTPELIMGNNPVTMLEFSEHQHSRESLDHVNAAHTYNFGDRSVKAQSRHVHYESDQVVHRQLSMQTWVPSASPHHNNNQSD
jgi:hypothetical protein